MTTGNEMLDADRISGLLVAAYQTLIADVWTQPHREVVLTQFKVMVPKQKYGEWLIVLNGTADDGTPMVAFMGGDDFPKAFRRAMAQYDDGSLKWRIDEWKLKNASTGN